MILLSADDLQSKWVAECAGVRRHSVRQVAPAFLEGAGDLHILEFEVQETSKITEQELRNLEFPKSAIIGGVIRGGKGLTTPGNFKFEPKDRVVVLSRPECIKKVESYFI